MKLFAVSLAYLASVSYAFCPLQTPTPQANSALNLFGGKKDGEAKDDAGGPGGLLGNLAMLKKAQEIQQKKAAIEKELGEMVFSGKSENEKVTANLKYIASKNPMDPQPEYGVDSFDFDDDWYNDAAPDDLSSGILEAYRAGIMVCQEESQTKFETIAKDVQAMFQGVAGAPGGEAPGGEAPAPQE
eukprot:CAMPEP_0178920170 /NCGR_PEP_ID=MMETSP0786-20121207/14855_1 /TAXON_ID=186022 /ORGANISM="Thalassionema frauenfeldii, Strain CCMP 1798" /LENGTH=185 /DNA_ID=CAMNT_0020594205 /DNA_START=76 /DNA_END=633 /DNA_ORIENTATION=-